MDTRLRLVGGDDSSVIPLDDEMLIRAGEAAVSAYNKNINTARLRIMPMARGLLAAKRMHPATQDFGAWLQTSPYRDLEKDDRAALIKIGEHDAFAADFVRTTTLISPQTIWKAIDELLRPTSYDTSSDEEPSPKPYHQNCVHEFFARASDPDIYAEIPDTRRIEFARWFLDELTVDGVLAAMSENFGSVLRARLQDNIDLKLTELRDRERKIDSKLKELRELKRHLGVTND
jgi:hypothetical protein